MSVDRAALIDVYQRTRARSRAIFDLVADHAYYDQPIALRHPIVFYEGHLPAFSFNTLIKRALGRPAIDASLEQIFARGIDPETVAGAEAGHGWPDRRAVQAFADEVDAQVVECLRSAEIERPGDALLDRAEAVFAILEHEAMHQETLLYMWHRLPFERKRRPDAYRPTVDAPVPRNEWVEVPAGCATLGIDRAGAPFGWDNEHPRFVANVGAFEIQCHDVTNAAFLEFVAARGYHDPRWWTADDWEWVRTDRIEHPLFWETDGRAWYWRGMFDRVRLPQSWPVYVSQAEAAAYARWQDARLMTEAEFQRAAYGRPGGGESRFPWGSDEPSARHGVFDFVSWDPQPAGSHPAGRSAWGIDDLIGNGWEWTSTPFAPFPGFHPAACYPEYSADFFDNQHVVMKGASPATAKSLLRPTFRNWFRPRYPYVYASFRCVRSAE